MKKIRRRKRDQQRGRAGCRQKCVWGEAKAAVALLSRQHEASDDKHVNVTRTEPNLPAPTTADVDSLRPVGVSHVTSGCNIGV